MHSTSSSTIRIPLIVGFFIALPFLAGGCSEESDTPATIVESHIREQNSDRIVTIRSIETSISGETAKVVGVYHISANGGWPEDIRDFVAKLRKYDGGWKIEGWNSVSQLPPQWMNK